MTAKFHTYSFSAFLLLFCSYDGWSDDRRTGFDPNLSLNQMIMDQWTNKNGLLSSNLTSVYQSQNGFIWVTGHNGLQRFDGVNFESYTVLNIPFLNSNSFYRIFEFEKDSLWFTTERSGIVGMHNNVAFSFNGNNIIPKAIITMFRSDKDELWIGTKNSGLYYKKGKGDPQKVSEIPEITINNIISDSQGNIWVATDGKGLYKISSQQTIIEYNKESGLISNVVNHLQIDNNDNIYVATLDGVNIIEHNKILKIDAFDGLDVNQIKIDDYGTIWLATEEGVARWNAKSKIFELFSEDDGLPARQVSGLTFDKEGSLWVSTKKAGLVRFRIGKITTISTLDGLTSDKINIIGKNDGTLYIGTDNGEINLLNSGNITQLNYDIDMEGKGIRDFLFDSKKRQWVVNYSGVLKIENGVKKKYDIDNGLPSSEVRRIFQDSKERIWIGTRTGGLVDFDEKSGSTIYDKSNGLSSNYILSIEEDLKGNIVIGTNAGGLSTIDEKDSVSTFHFQNDDSGILIFNTHIDENNGYLLCTNIGLYYFIDGEFTNIQIGSDANPKTFFDLIDDTIGGYWLTSNFGILRIEKSDIEKQLNGELSFIKYDLYDNNEGMLNNECTGATRSFLDTETGKIYIPTFQGVAVVDPSINLTNETIPEVYITSLKVDDNPLNVNNSPLKIAPGALRYTFDFTALSYLSPAKVTFKYKLEGFDKDWIGPVHNRSVEYTNLPYGNYTFKVRGTNSSGIWNEQGANLSFFVTPFFYKTVWFYLICALFITLILGLIYKWRIRDITARNQALAKINTELDRFVYSTSHDLRAPLASTISLINIARMESSSEVKNEYIDLIEGCMNKMDHFISDIIDFSRNKNAEVKSVMFNIKELASEIFANLKYLDHAATLKSEIEVIGDNIISGDMLRIKMILSNLITNAILYSNDKNPYVKVLIDTSKSPMEITIEDNGIGISEVEKNKVFEMFYRANDKSKGSGLGLYIVKETVDKLGGKIKMKSKLGEGTTFRISLPNLNK
ncbi:two-component regulator propeller domain-containing protein [Reichenbachiella sp. MALMAid0571]|uniref:sensor histidine kinase n=1 Tax=Reichenbachiella sp. MALMAid0571 TaxID=3143939 RepID=UPI0032DF2039